MTNPEPPGTARPARAAGYALLGVAVVALVIGVVSLFTGGDGGDVGAQTGTPTSGESAAPPSGQSPNPPSDQSQATTGTSPDPGSTTTRSSTAPTTSTAPAGSPSTTGAPPPVTVPARPQVRVYNNSTIGGLAAKASDDVRRAGWEVAEVGNYPQGQIPTTTVYFRPGTEEEASAQLLAQALRAEVKPRFEGIEDAHAGIIVIVTNDYRGPGGKV
ncbi:LytR C-terminal domain-containing protein [Saccharothrix australiensis]|uniref:LytR cell envelope-related transcriptional attenuator n=1 Tax=Saccharothrix australiensis TaxID=2072 RepID=A0A495VTR7_9PSEU|nr:LytR C-terminal domain-containing protein [Saccharothrix australiensis]RKT52270.1 LytR cell envelope-related transcriptional attenuator [Saccharothrix australiensis]